MKRIAVQFSLHLPAKVTKKKKWFVASCPILDVHSQGETEDQAKKSLAEALSLFFISCHDRGALDAILKDCGFISVHPSATQQKITALPENEYINVPIPFYVNLGNRQRCHV